MQVGWGRVGVCAALSACVASAGVNGNTSPPASSEDIVSADTSETGTSPPDADTGDSSLPGGTGDSSAASDPSETDVPLETDVLAETDDPPDTDPMDGPSDTDDATCQPDGFDAVEPFPLTVDPIGTPTELEGRLRPADVETFLVDVPAGCALTVSWTVPGRTEFVILSILDSGGGWLAEVDDFYTDPGDTLTASTSARSQEDTVTLSFHRAGVLDTGLVSSTCLDWSLSVSLACTTP